MDTTSCPSTVSTPVQPTSISSLDFGTTSTPSLSPFSAQHQSDHVTGILKTFPIGRTPTVSDCNCYNFLPCLLHSAMLVSGVPWMPLAWFLSPQGPCTGCLHCLEYSAPCPTPSAHLPLQLWRAVPCMPPTSTSWVCHYIALFGYPGTLASLSSGATRSHREINVPTASWTNAIW